MQEVFSEDRATNYGKGYAASDADSRYPTLWRGLQGWWCAPTCKQKGIIDYSFYRWNGVFAGAAPAFWSAGEEGLAVDFPGVTGYAEIASSTRFDSAVGTWAFRLLTRSLPSSSDAALSRIASNRRSGIVMYVFSDGKFYYETKTNNGTAADSSTAGGYTVPLNKWVSYILTWSQANGGANNLYINGLEDTVSATTNSAAWSFNNQVIRLADCLNTTDFEITDGLMRDVGIWNRKLTPAEIWALGRGGSPLTLQLRKSRTYRIGGGVIDTGSGAATFTLTAGGGGAADATGSGTATFSFTATGGGKADATGSGTATANFTAAGGGRADATGSGAATATFTAAAGSLADATGVGAATCSFTATGVGVADATGSGAATFTITTAGGGAADATGAGSASFSFTASGAPGGNETTSGTATFSITAAAGGAADATGSGTATISFTAAAVGLADATAAGTATFSFTATGVPQVATNRTCKLLVTAVRQPYITALERTVP